MTKRSQSPEDTNSVKKSKFDEASRSEKNSTSGTITDNGLTTPANDFNNFVDSLSQKEEKESKGKNEVSYSKKNLYRHNDQGPFIVFMETLTTNRDSKPINDIRMGKLMKAKKLMNDIIELRQTGRHRIKISFSNKHSANQLINDINLVTENLKAFIPSQFIQRIGIVKNIETDLSNEELIENIKCPDNIDIKETNRFFRTIKTSGKDDKKVPLTTVKLIFLGQKLPEFVYIYNVKRKVQPYIFSVTQCFKCLRYGHTKKNCKSKTSNCQNCGEIHEATNGKCERQQKCVNCKEQHISVNNECTEYIRQRAIKNIMSLKNLSFGEANEEFPKIRNSFSLLENVDDFPALPGIHQKDHQTRIQIAKTERMYQSYREKKQKTPRFEITRVPYRVENEVELPNSPILSNPHKTPDSDRILEKLKQSYNTVLEEFTEDEAGNTSFVKKIQEMFRSLKNQEENQNHSELVKSSC